MKMDYIQKMKSECEKELKFFKENFDSENEIVESCGVKIKSQRYIDLAFDEIQHRIEQDFFGEDYDTETAEHEKLNDIRCDYEIEAREFLNSKI